MAKVVYNACFGGFSLSEAAIRRYAELKGLTLYPEKSASDGLITYWTVPPNERADILEGRAFFEASMEARHASNEKYERCNLYSRDLKRTDPILIRVVEEMGDAASGAHAQLRIAEIPAGSKYRIDEYDGNETVATPDSYKWEIAE